MGEITELTSIELIAKSSTYEIRIKSKAKTDRISEVIDSLIEQVSKSKSFSPVSLSSTPLVSTEQNISPGSSENLLRLFATKINVNADAFESSNLVAIKNDSVQLMKPSALKQSECCYLLLAINEYVLGRDSMTYDEWRELCESSKIKGNTPFHKVVDNAKRYGHINQKKYDSAKEIVLEPKRVEVVKKAIEKYLSNGHLA